MDHTLPPLCGTLAALQITPTSSGRGVFVSLEFHHPTHSLSSPASSASPTPSSRVTVHPHLIGEKEFDIFLSKAHLVVRMIQLKMGQDLLLQVTRGITLQLVALISEISPVTHPPFLPHSLLSSLTPFSSPSLLSSLPPSQVFHKLLTLASTASQTREFGHWHHLLISTGGVRSP